MYVAENGAVGSVAGYRFIHTLAWGHILYIDDLAALKTFQGTGLGPLLLQHLQAEARRNGCAAVHLDTGYQRISLIELICGTDSVSTVINTWLGLSKEKGGRSKKKAENS